MFVPYSDNQTVLEGYFASSVQKKALLVILCHTWRGRDPFICEKTDLIASWGFHAFALDMYGKGVLGNSKEENARLKKPFTDDRIFLKRRLLKGYEVACDSPYVDPSRIVVLGFGFGGLCALDLARSGVPLQGAISVYGHYDELPNAHLITARLLFLHGMEDPITPVAGLLDFQRANSKTDCQIHLYSQTLHAFMTPGTQDPATGLLYNSLSAERAWSSIRQFITDCL
jgi:dienelactone hydrolase